MWLLHSHPFWTRAFQQNDSYTSQAKLDKEMHTFEAQSETQNQWYIYVCCCSSHWKFTTLQRHGSTTQSQAHWRNTLNYASHTHLATLYLTLFAWSPPMLVFDKGSHLFLDGQYFVYWSFHGSVQFQLCLYDGQNLKMASFIKINDYEPTKARLNLNLFYQTQSKHKAHLAKGFSCLAIFNFINSFFLKLNLSHHLKHQTHKPIFITNEKIK